MDGEFEKQLRSGLILVPQTNILRHTGLLSLVKPPTAWSAAPSLKGLVNGNNRFRLSEVVLITHNFNTLLLAPRLTVQVATGPFAPILRRTRRAGPVLPPGHPGPRLGASDTAEAAADQDRQRQSQIVVRSGLSGIPAQQCALGNYTTMLVLLVLTPSSSGRRLQWMCANDRCMFSLSSANV